MHTEKSFCCIFIPVNSLITSYVTFNIEKCTVEQVLILILLILMSDCHPTTRDLAPLGIFTSLS